MHILPVESLSSQCIEALSGVVLDQGGAFDSGVVPRLPERALLRFVLHLSLLSKLHGRVLLVCSQ